MKDSDAKKNAGERYGDELLSANWNPVIDLLQNPGTGTSQGARAERELRDEDVEAFLGRIYTFGS